MKHISLDLISLLGLSVIYSQQHQIQSCRNWSWLHGLILMCFRWQSYSIFYSAWFRFKRLFYLFCCHIFHTFKIFVTTVFHLKLPVYRFAIKASQCSTLPSDPCDLMMWNFVSNTYQVYIFNHWFMYLFSIHIWDCFQCMVLRVSSKEKTTTTTTEDGVHKIQERTLSIKFQTSFLPTFYFLWFCCLLHLTVRIFGNENVCVRIKDDNFW